MAILAAVIVSLLQLATSADRASAQTRYSYLPSAATNDFRFISITGAGIQTLGDQTLLFKISAPAGSTTFSMGVFDGDTGGMWDQGTQPLEYTLFADPTADATGTFQVQQWSGSSMPDNAWFNATVNNATQAKGASGDFFYLLRVRALDYSTMFWSNFKLRASGSIVALRLTNIAYTAPLNGLNDAQRIYPNYPALSPTIYDGVWDFDMNVPTPQAALEIWDGDFDHGSSDCSDNDTDDQDTPNTIPPFATGAAVRPEGIAGGTTIPCANALGVPTGGMTTSNPADNSASAVFRRDPAIMYTVTDPNGNVYTNNNPSGNLEWERFRIDTAAFNRNTMDYHAASLPAGIYHIHISGVDLSNLNALRVPFDILGIDSNNIPQPQPTPFFITGTVWDDANGNGRIDTGESTISGAVVTLSTGTTITTGATGTYTFSALQAQTYTVRVAVPNGGGIGNDDGDDDDDDNDHDGNHHDGDHHDGDHHDGDHHDNDGRSCNGSHHNDNDDEDGGCTWAPTYDFDGIATPNAATVALTTTRGNATLSFGYACASDTDDDHHDCNHHDRDDDCRDNKSLSYWACHQSNWSCNSMTLGNRTYCKNDLVKIISRACSSQDKSYTIAAELIACKLNRAHGDGSSTTNSCIKDCDTWLHSHPVGCNVHDDRNSPWTDGKRNCDRTHRRNNCDDDSHIH